MPDIDGFWVFIQMSDGAFADRVKIGPATDMAGIYGADGYRYDPWSQSRVHEMDYWLFVHSNPRFEKGDQNAQEITQSNVACGGRLDFGLVLATSGKLSADQANNPDNDSPMNLANHHKDKTFPLLPGQFRLIQFPKSSVPIFVMMSNSATQNITSGVLAVDPATGAPFECVICYTDGETRVDVVGPNQEIAVFNDTTDKTITFYLSMLY